jgi:hypothetical protein
MERDATLLRMGDAALPGVGVVLLLAGVTAWPWLVPLGWLALVLAFVSWVAETEGIALPRPGRLPIRAYGCWETPLAFSVRYEGLELLFSRDEDEHGDWASQYTVRERPAMHGSDVRFELPVRETGAWSVRGQAPVTTLRFEHRERVSYVTQSSLERALGLRS